MKLTQRASSAYHWLDNLSGNRIGILRQASRTFAETRGAQAAAALAYYAFFSLFPLLLALVVAAGFFVAGAGAQKQVLDFVAGAIPISRTLIERNLQQVLEVRGSVGLVALIILIWSAAGFFTALAHTVNQAFSGAEPRGFLGRRLVGLSMIGVLFALLFVSLLAAFAAALAERLQFPLLGDYNAVVWGIGARVLPWGITLLLFLVLYRWVPNTEVRWRAAFWGALIVATAWEVLKVAFAWYLGSGLVKYELVYGSLATVVALLFWIYLSSWLAVFGAHLTAAISDHAVTIAREPGQAD